MKKRFKAGLSITFAIILVAVMTISVSARRVSPWVGRWQTTDIVDGSTNTLTISFLSSASSYNLNWQETYFTICSGDPGVGLGTGTEDQIGLHTNINFYCKGAPTGTFNINFTWDSSTDTITSDDGQVWERISPRLW
jgi:hypothetical protein